MSEDVLFNLYVEETREHLEKISECLLKLEKSPGDREYINTLFRSVHTIKSSTFMMGYQKTGEMIHKLEDIISLARDNEEMVLEEKTIQLFFLCNDYLEHFLQAVIAGENEDEIKTEHIYKSLCDVLEGFNNTSEAECEVLSPENETRLEFSKEEIINLENLQKDWKQVFALYIRFAESCIFPEVNAWMIISEIVKNLEYIKSLPQITTEQEFKDGLFKLPEREVCIILASENKAEMLKDVISGNVLNDIDIMHIDPLKISNGILEGKYFKYNNKENCYHFDAEELLVKEYDGDIDSSDNSKGSSENIEDGEEAFTGKILDKIKEAEIAFLELKFNPTNEASVKTLYKIIHAIEGIADFISRTDIYELANDTAALIDINYKNNGKVEDFALELILKSINYLKLLGEGVVISDEKTISELNAHKQLIEGDVIHYFEKISKKLKPKVEENLAGKKLGEILIEKGKLDHATIDSMLELQKSLYPELKMGQVLVKEEMVSLKDVSEALNIQGNINNQGKNEVKKAVDAIVRIPEQKVDNLVDMMGELLILQSLLKENVINGSESSNLSVLNNVERMERIIKDMQSISMSFRMVSLKQTFQKILRIGRDTARELRKDVDFNIVGEDTEIDRSIVEKIQDPLMHLVRNSISHGIENVDKRKEVGKKTCGIVEIKAYNKKGNVYIEINDDGKGLDTEKILQKAIDKGIASKGKNYSENEIINFIFLPGFSTAENINNISGRGVGMNVVDIEIRRIGGKIEVKNEIGKGCSFILKIPVNLATVNGTIIDIMGDRYIVPTVSVKQIFKPTKEQIIKVKGKIQSIKNREDIVSIIPIKSFLGIDFEESMMYDSVVIILEYDGDLRALPVKNVLGKQEVVIKPLNSEFQHLKCLSGATILGDGKVSLILDVEALFGFSRVEFEADIGHKELVEV